MIEIFKDIPNYEGYYQVSNLGRVKSMKRLSLIGRKLKEKILKTPSNSNGYSTVVLCREDFRENKTVHQLVAMSFLNHKPKKHKLVVNHINFIRNDNRVENLEIVTQRENSNRKHCKSTSKYVGVSWCKTYEKWLAKIIINRKRTCLGYHHNEIDAHNAYQDKLKQL